MVLVVGSWQTTPSTRRGNHSVMGTDRGRTSLSGRSWMISRVHWGGTTLYSINCNQSMAEIARFGQFTCVFKSRSAVRCFSRWLFVLCTTGDGWVVRQLGGGGTRFSGHWDRGICRNKYVIVTFIEASVACDIWYCMMWYQAIYLYMCVCQDVATYVYIYICIPRSLCWIYLFLLSDTGHRTPF